MIDATPSEDQQALYQLAFVHNRLTVITRTHKGMDIGSLNKAEEPHITGELVKAAKALLESSEADAWMEHLEVLDDPPQNAPNRHGKKRARIDIEFVSVVRGRRPRFLIEAKRLYRSDSISEYFGAGGMQMIVRGQYAAEWHSAGMLGYVQSDSCAKWLKRLAVGLVHRQAELACKGRADWGAVVWRDEALEEVRVSKHQRTPQGLGHIEIFHLLLNYV